jgi:hypothetical protein
LNVQSTVRRPWLAYLHAEGRVVEAPEDGGEDEAGDGDGGQAHPEELRGALDVLPRPPHQHQDLRPPRVRERAHRLRVRLVLRHQVLHLRLRRLRLRAPPRPRARRGRPALGLLRHALPEFRLRVPLSAVLHQVLDPFLSCDNFTPLLVKKLGIRQVSRFRS